MTTPEPWLILCHPHSQEFSIYGKNGSLIARVKNLDDARLLAKAAKLLRACQAIAAYHDSKFKSNRDEALRLVHEALAFTPEER
jgi:hypothetical protein